MWESQENYWLETFHLIDFCMSATVPLHRPHLARRLYRKTCLMPLGREYAMLNCNEYWLVLICLLFVKNQLSLTLVKEEKCRLNNPCFTPILDCSHWSYGGYEGTTQLLGGQVDTQEIGLFRIPNCSKLTLSLGAGNVLPTSCGLRGRGWFGIEGELGVGSHLMPESVVLMLWSHS